MRLHRSQIDPRTRWSHKASGFTLVEVVAVLLLVSILAAVAVPAVNSMGSSRGSMAAKQLLRDVTFARQNAIATGVKTWVRFNAGTESWTLWSEDAANPGRANASVMEDAATGQQYTITLGSGAYYGVAVTSAAFDGNDEIGFDWLGRPYNESETELAADGTVVLNSGHTLSVLKGSGLAQLASP